MQTQLGGIIRFLFLMVVVSLYINSPLYSDTNMLGHKQENSPEDLDTILNKCAVYCEILANASLFFVCNERIEETKFEHNFVRYYKNRVPRKVEENTYVYDYQLIKKGTKIEESRILLEENGKKMNEKDAQLKAQMFYSKRSVFGPVGLLIRENHDKYNYKILDEETVSGSDLPPKYRSRSYVRISQGRKEKKWAGNTTKQNRLSACFGRLKCFRARV